MPKNQQPTNVQSLSKQSVPKGNKGMFSRGPNSKPSIPDRGAFSQKLPSGTGSGGGSKSGPTR